MSGKPKIAIACQGGGSQTAFTAGALKAFCESSVINDVDLVSISGTSGGAVCAALLWYALERNETPLWGRLIAFWKENTAQGWAEESFNRFLVDSIRMTNTGLVPSLQFSPASPLVQAVVGFATMAHRPTFKDFDALLRKHIDFDEVRSWGPRAKRPILMIGAANVLTGKLTKFISRRETICVEHILASCAVPNIFPAVRIGEDAYWDGLFSDNPPVQELIRPLSVGAENIPDEIWVIKINPTTAARVPERSDDIVNRRNELDGNISLFHQLRQLEMINDMLLDGAFCAEYLGRLDVKDPVRIPKSFPSDDDKKYHIPAIEMPLELAHRLDFESKIDRSAANIDMLMDEGRRAFDTFVAKRAG